MTEYWCPICGVSDPRGETYHCVMHHGHYPGQAKIRLPSEFEGGMTEMNEGQSKPFAKQLADAIIQLETMKENQIKVLCLDEKARRELSQHYEWLPVKLEEDGNGHFRLVTALRRKG